MLFKWDLSVCKSRTRQYLSFDPHTDSKNCKIIKASLPTFNKFTVYLSHMPPPNTSWLHGHHCELEVNHTQQLSYMHLYMGPHLTKFLCPVLTKCVQLYMPCALAQLLQLRRLSSHTIPFPHTKHTLNTCIHNTPFPPFVLCHHSSWLLATQINFKHKVQIINTAANDYNSN